MNKTEIIQKIKSLDGLSNDEKAYLVNLVNTKKKYGLVWEDKPEDVEEQLRTHLPVLKEVIERRIMSELGKKSEPGFTGFQDSQDLRPLKSKPLQTSLFGEPEIQGNPENQKNHGSDNAPNHILIEGDNLHALTALTFTHEGAIDVIYIDPPYNTGNKDFKYNDSFVDREDSYRHSKWLSFMDKRLRIAKRLLSEKGVVFISIDDNEQAQLKILCDEVFGDQNFVADIIWEKKYSPQNDAKWFSANHDYILVYAKLKDNWRPNLLLRTEEQNARYKNPDNDPRGVWKMSDLSVKTYSAEYDYPITTPSGRIAKLPAGRCWMTSQVRMQEFIADNRIWFGKNGDNIPALKRFLSEVKQGVTPMTIWFRKDVGDNQEGKQELVQIIPENLFQTPKVVRLLKKILMLSTNESSIILDFFAGSGTTLHATMQLNAEDGGNRQCILVTNNENNIAEEVCYERNRRVIQGYTNSKGEWVPGLTNNNLRYYKNEFVSREPSLKNKRELTCLANELLCIKEDCYEEKSLNHDLEGLKDWQDEGVGLQSIKKALKNEIRLFSERGKNLMVIYNEDAIEEAVALIKYLLKNKSWKSHHPENHGSDIFKVYVFANGQYAYAEEFEDIAENITLAALPDAIYKAYQNVLPKENREFIPELEDEANVEPQMDAE